MINGPKTATILTDRVDDDSEIREKLAAIQHDIWSHWMEYLFSVSAYNEDGSVTIPSDKVTRWAEQLKTNYFWLSEQEKQSDRDQADKVMAVLYGQTG